MERFLSFGELEFNSEKLDELTASCVLVGVLILSDQGTVVLVGSVKDNWKTFSQFKLKDVASLSFKL